MFKAKDIMTKKVVTVKEKCPVYDAMNMLINNNITGLPVVDAKNELVGMLSEKDMLNILYNDDVADKTVDEMMTHEVISFDETDNIVEICDCLMGNNFRRVPITSDGKLVGIISRRDLVRFILKIRKKTTAKK